MDERQETLLIKWVVWRLVPLLTVIYLIAYIDRTNIGCAKLTMVQSPGITEAQFGFTASLFFVSYPIFEVPSNLALSRFGARL